MGGYGGGENQVANEYAEKRDVILVGKKPDTGSIKAKNKKMKVPGSKQKKPVEA